MKMVLTNQNIVEAHEVTQINTAGQLTFTATIKSDVDEKIETTDIVFVKVKDDRYHPYKIVQSNMPTPNTIQYTCIEYAYYLFAKDGLVHDKRPEKLSVGETITQIIMGTKWKVGYTDLNLPTFTGNFYWQTRTDCFKELVEGTGAELEFYMTMANNKITSRTIEAYKQRGTDTHQRFTYGMNALEVIAEEDATNAVTKVYPRGSGEMYTSDGGGQRKLTISDVEWSKAKGDPTDKPKGQDYLVYGSAKYDLDNGNQPSSIVEFQDEKDANKLIRKAFNWLKQNNRPKVQFKAKVSDVGDLKLGDRVVIDREDLGIKYVTRVFKLDRNLLNEKLNTIELGDVVAHTLADAISNVSSSLADTNKRVDSVTSSITDANGNTVTYGPNEPTTKKKGDTWYKPGDIVDGIQQYDVYVWDGEKWVLTIGNQLQNELLSKVEQAQKDTEEAKQQAQQASDKADQIVIDFNKQIGDIQTDVNGAKEDAASALSDAQKAIQQADFNNQAITKIEKQQSDDGKRLTIVENNYNGIQSTVSDLANNTNSRFDQFSNLINTNISNINKNSQQISNVQQSFNQFQVDVKKSDVDNLFIDSEFYDINKLISNRPLSNVSVLADETYVGSRILHWKGNLGTWAQLQFQRIIIPYTLNNKVVVGFNYRFPKSSSRIMASFYFKRQDESLISKKEEYLQASDEEINTWLEYSLVANIPSGTAYIDFLFNQNGTDDFEMSRPRLYAGSIDWGYNANTAYSQAQIKVQADRIEETVQNQDALNKRVQTAESTVESISNMTGNNTIVNTVKGQQQQIQDASGNALNALKTAQGVQTSVYNTGNIWMTPDFQNTPLSKYTNTSDSDTNVHIIANGARATANDPIKYNVPFKKKNPSTKSIRFEGRTDGNRDCFQKEEYNIQVSAGDVFDVSFDFYKTPEGSAGVGFKLIADDGSINWIALYATQESQANWWHIDGQITVPNDRNYIKAQAFISYGRVKSAGQYCYMDNVSIKKATGTNVAQYSNTVQTVDLIRNEVKDFETNTTGRLDVMSNNINAKVDKDGLITQINISPGNVLIDGQKVHITGQTTIDNAVITSSMIKDVNADKITAGTLNAANVKIVNLDVNTLGGDYATFLKTAWKDSNSYSEITADGMKFFEKAGNIWENDAYLNIYASQLTWKSSNKAYHYIARTQEKTIANRLTIGGVTNGETFPASVLLRTDAYDNFTAVKKSAHIGGRYTFVGELGYTGISDGFDDAMADISNAQQKDFTATYPCYGVRIAAQNNISLALTQIKDGNRIRFSALTTNTTTETNLIYKGDNGMGMVFQSKPTYYRTYSSSANLFITENGYIGRSTSARKYKQDIEYIDNIDEAKRTLDIQPAEWADKKQMMSHARARAGISNPEDEERLARRYIGFIADDFADAGFEKLIVRDKTGAVEEFQYNRLSVYHHQMIKDLYNQIDILKNEIKELKGDN